MAEPIARIRAYEDDDNKQVRFVIGKSNLESLAIANRRGQCPPSSDNSLPLTVVTIFSLAYIHPLSISLWILASCILIQYMQWWPSNEQGFLGYLSPLPALGSMAVPIMFLVDW